MWRKEKTEDGQDLIWDGAEKGIADSPHEGTANLQGVNLQTEMGEVMVSYARVMQSQSGTTAPTFTINVVDSSHLQTSFNLTNGVWVTIGSGITGLTPGQYYVQNSTGTSVSSATIFQISATYNGSSVSGFSSGPATGNLFRAMGQPVQAATETYINGSNVTQYRYYVLDINGLVWVFDTGLVNSQITGVLNWFLPDTTILATNANAGGIAVFNGYVHVFVGNVIYVKETVLLGNNNAGGIGWDTFTGGSLNSSSTSFNSHFALVTQNNTLTYCDGAFVGTIESSSNSGTPATAPIWSYGQYGTTGSGTTTTITVANQIGGSNIINGSTVTFTSSGTPPTGISVTALYYVINANISGASVTFSIATTPGGSAITLGVSTNGAQYFNTYKPSHSSGNTTYIFSPQALTLPFTAVSQCLCEIGTEVVVGTQSNALYFWDEIAPLPNNFIPLPENNSKYMINVNNMAYIFAGSKGNIYITNGSTASAAISVPDYCAGVPGTPSSYIEPYFTWGGAAYIRGRVYFSIQDQTTTKTGNCGGVWSFVPTQNLFAGQDVGLALRLEAQNSYANYNGFATVLLNSQNQNANGPQYWTGWISSVSSPTYGIDFSSTLPFVGGSIIETDGVAIGTLLDKTSLDQIEYKLATPLASGESVSMKYRLNLTDAWTSLAQTQIETTNPLAGIFTPNFQNAQWLQLQATLISTNANPTFVRLTEIRVR